MSDAPLTPTRLIVVAAFDRDEEGELLATSLMQAFVALRSGTPGKLKPPLPGYADTLRMVERAPWTAPADPIEGVIEHV